MRRRVFEEGEHKARPGQPNCADVEGRTAADTPVELDVHWAGLDRPTTLSLLTDAGAAKRLAGCAMHGTSHLSALFRCLESRMQRRAWWLRLLHVSKGLVERRELWYLEAVAVAAGVGPWFISVFKPALVSRER